MEPGCCHSIRTPASAAKVFVLRRTSGDTSVPTVPPSWAYRVKPMSSDSGVVQCVLETSEEGVRYVNDFREAAMERYSQYLQRLKERATTDLNLQMSAQPAYNLPMDMESTVPVVNAPKCESLGVMDNVDGYRQFSGPAVLAGKRIVSNEMGAVSMAAF
ncbi:hypothetical protein AnigIFM49718_011343 [Aspergillus niger]|nr:hypothetical protein AnigIFM49718_011343 [Aspergillus niger]GLA21316.1 hypothetical protein AnigIFM62618_010623 [Aspergillus niger]